MKKFLTLLLIFIILCTTCLVGCDKDINANTNPEEIVSDKVSETEWRAACRYIGMFDIEHIINGGEPEGCDSVTVSFWISQELLDHSEFAEYKLIVKLDMVESEMAGIEGYNIYEEGYFKSKDGKVEEESGRRHVQLNPGQLRRSKTYVYSHFSEFMTDITDNYSEFTYSEEIKAYVNDGDIKVKFKDSKIVAYSEGDEWLIFYDYDSSPVTVSEIQNGGMVK